MALKDCPDEDDLDIPRATDSLSAIVLLRSMQRKDLPLWVYRHTARQLLQHTAHWQLINRRVELGRNTRLIKVRAHSGEPLNEAADAPSRISKITQRGLKLTFAKVSRTTAVS